jgi:hypothetical protein
MHFGMDLDRQPKQLLVVGPSNFTHDAEQSAIVETKTNVMHERGYEPHMHAYQEL